MSRHRSSLVSSSPSTRGVPARRVRFRPPAPIIGRQTPPAEEDAVLARLGKEAGRTFRGIAAGVGARKRLFAVVAAAVFVMDIVVPPAVLSLSRKPVDYFTFNPWLVKLPE